MARFIGCFFTDENDGWVFLCVEYGRVGGDLSKKLKEFPNFEIRGRVWTKCQ